MSARHVRLAVKLACSVCTTRPDFHPGLANLCTPPLHFWRQPPQLNCPSDSVLPLDFYVGVSKISSFRRVVFHCCPDCSGLPPILYMLSQNPMSRCSKAPRGLSVLSRVTGIFTGATISPSPSLRQRSSRYAIRAGRNLPDKEFRYLRTVIVTAAVHRSLSTRLQTSDTGYQIII